MLDTFDPPTPRANRFAKLAEHARKVAVLRTETLEFPDTHSLRVAALSTDVAERIGFLRHEVDAVAEGALLHDVGKSRVPREILEQDRRLTDEEFAIVRKHPTWGAALVDGFVEERALGAIRHHHEWWNGGGYPSGLAGHEIPLEARIVGIADAFVAMRERRPYRSAKSMQDAVGELRRNTGTQFDPALVDPLIECVIAEERPPLRLASLH